MIQEQTHQRDEIKESNFASEEVLGIEKGERFTINVKETQQEKKTRKSLEEYKTDNRLSRIKLASKGFKSSTAEAEILAGPNSPLAQIMGREKKKRPGCCLFCC